MLLDTRPILDAAPCSSRRRIGAGWWLTLALLAGLLLGATPAQAAGPKAVKENCFDCHSDTTMTKDVCLLYTSPSPRDRTRSRMPSSA